MNDNQDLDTMLAKRVDEMKRLQAEAQKAKDFLAQVEQQALRLDGQMALLVEMGGQHPEIVPPPPPTAALESALDAPASTEHEQVEDASPAPVEA